MINHFLAALLALLIVFISSNKKALMIRDLTHPAQSTPPYGLETVLLVAEILLWLIKR